MLAPFNEYAGQPRNVADGAVMLRGAGASWGAGIVCNASSTGQVTCATLPNVLIANAFFLGVKLVVKAWGGNQFIAGWTLASPTFHQILLNTVGTGRIDAALRNGGASIVASATGLSAASEYIVALRATPAVLDIWVNGSLRARTTRTVSVPNTWATFELGHSTNDSFWDDLDGRVEWVVALNAVMSEDDMRRHGSLP
jgi:hypothetical protein